jgi:lipopolysaccharide transport system ATP-binding protein
MNTRGPRRSSGCEVAIDARGLCKHYRVFKGGDRGWLKYAISPFGDRTRFYDVNPALSEVNLVVAPGETVGIVGRNGSGKSTLLKTLAGVSLPTAGRVELNGQVRCLLGTGIGFHERLSGRENILFGSLVMGIPPATARARMDQIIDFAELWDFIEQPTMFYSSGMRARLALAVALQEVPDILMIDEALSAGDAYFQDKCVGRIEEVCSSGSTVLIVTHSVETVSELCSRAILLDRGRIVIDGAPDEVIDRYREHLVEQQQRRLASLDEHVEARPEPLSSTPLPASSKRLELVDSYMTGADGRRRTSFEHGEPVELHLKLRAVGRLPTLRFALDVFADSGPGVRIAQLGTEHLSAETHDLDGEYDLCVRWPANPLGSGNYYWTLRVGPFSQREARGSAEYLRTGKICAFRSASFPGHPLGALRHSILEPDTHYELKRVVESEEPATELVGQVKRIASVAADARGGRR